jgi:uncharacterized protein YdbL (DUF1318 family)
MENPSCQPVTPLHLTVALAAFSLAACTAPTVQLATSEPIKVDIDVRLDVYQHNAPTPKAASPSPTPANPDSRRRSRMADIQNFKNQRLVGEGRDGLLVIRSTPGGDYGEYVRAGVEAENADRMELMKSLAESRKQPLTEIQTRQAEAWRDRSFEGEWIEIPTAEGGWQWVQKEK